MHLLPQCTSSLFLPAVHQSVERQPRSRLGHSTYSPAHASLCPFQWLAYQTEKYSTELINRWNNISSSTENLLRVDKKHAVINIHNRLNCYLVNYSKKKEKRILDLFHNREEIVHISAAIGKRKNHGE